MQTVGAGARRSAERSSGGSRGVTSAFTTGIERSRNGSERSTGLPSLFAGSFCDRRPGSDVLHGVQRPRARYALELVVASLLEADPGPATRSLTVDETRTSPDPAC